MAKFLDGLLDVLLIVVVAAQSVVLVLLLVELLPSLLARTSMRRKHCDT